MFKKLLILIIALLPVVAKAQLMTGEWYTYPTYGQNISNIVESDAKVYFLSVQNLYSYDKDTQEVYSYTMQNKLNDSHIDNIFFNHDDDYLMVVYENGNIDLLYEDGRVYNFSDIKDAVLTTSKAINDVAFSEGKIYVATAFGLVVLDAAKNCVIESGIYNKSITTIAVDKGNILAIENNTLYYSPVENNHYSFSAFNKISGAAFKYMFTSRDSNDDWIYGITTSNELYKLNFNPQNGTISNFSRVFDGDNNAVSAMLYGDSADKGCFIVAPSYSYVAKINNGVATKNTVPSSLKSKSTAMSVFKDFKNIWMGSINGLGSYDISASTPTVVVSDFKPDACTVQMVAYLTPSADGNRVYVSNVGMSNYKNCYVSNGGQNGGRDLGTINLLKDGTLTNVTPAEVSAYQARTQTYHNQVWHYPYLIAPSQLAEAKDDPSTYYMGCMTEGVYKIKDGVEVGSYTSANAPFIPFPGLGQAVLTYGVSVDRGGNLWVFTSNGNGTDAKGLFVDILPYEKTLLPTDQVTVNDWIKIRDPYFINNAITKDVDMLVCKHSNMIFILQGWYNTNLMAYDTKGTFNDFTDDEWYVWKDFTDQDGKSFSLINSASLLETNDGKVWVGGYKGVVEITNPSEATSPSMRVNRLKVPRNDGTNFADYLLETQEVRDMTVDNANRKWIGTNSSGLYLVSPDGDQILEHYTTENSQLPANQVNVVYADKNSNRVYIGTNYGLSYYNSTASPSSSDYSEVVAFPNPVRPEYSGWITIKGLMDSSYVKIADASLQVINSGQSQGGSFMWDACDYSGNRVKSGVYYVFASQTQSSGVQGKPVTKILVVN